jgi:hypothetical protein
MDASGDAWSPAGRNTAAMTSAWITSVRRLFFPTGRHCVLGRGARDLKSHRLALFSVAAPPTVPLPWLGLASSRAVMVVPMSTVGRRALPSLPPVIVASLLAGWQGCVSCASSSHYLIVDLAGQFNRC